MAPRRSIASAWTSQHEASDLLVVVIDTTVDCIWICDDSLADGEQACVESRLPLAMDDVVYLHHVHVRQPQQQDGVSRFYHSLVDPPIGPEYTKVEHGETLDRIIQWYRSSSFCRHDLLPMPPIRDRTLAEMQACLGTIGHVTVKVVQMDDATIVVGDGQASLMLLGALPRFQRPLEQAMVDATSLRLLYVVTKSIEDEMVLVTTPDTRVEVLEAASVSMQQLATASSPAPSHPCVASKVLLASIRSAIDRDLVLEHVSGPMTVHASPSIFETLNVNHHWSLQTLISQHISLQWTLDDGNHVIEVTLPHL